MTMLRTRFLPFLATLMVSLSLACGGARQTSYPGPEPLTLTLTEPADGAVVDHPDLAVRGQVSQANALVTCNGTTVTGDASGNFQCTVQLQAGPNQVVVEAWRPEDAKTGRGSSLLPPEGKVAAREVRNVTYQQQPALTMVVTAPDDGATFTVTPIAVQGTVSNPSATVTMNGIALSVDASGNFQGTADLHTGTLDPNPNPLVFLATAPNNLTATETRTVFYTVSPPPEAGMIVTTRP